MSNYAVSICKERGIIRTETVYIWNSFGWKTIDASLATRDLTSHGAVHGFAVCAACIFVLQMINYYPWIKYIGFQVFNWRIYAMSIADAIKKSVLEKFQANTMTTTSIVVTLGLAIALGLFIYFVYRINARSGLYNRGFNKSLATLPVITAAIMLAMGSNLTISLGMVGALSIVRFRNAVKDPADLTYLFWSISIGIVVGAGLFELAILLSLAVAVLVSALDLLPVFRCPCVLVVSGTDMNVEKELMLQAKSCSKTVMVRSRNITKRGVEWILELQTRNEADLVQKVSGVENITSVHLLTHSGEVRF